jgi:regulator of sigma E protease
MLEKVLIFFLFLGPLIFFHELGHFLFARFFGVRVETFSLGFGPKILKFKKDFTDYTISLIPLGGYVKMFGDDPLSEKELSDEEKKYAYTHKSKWARFWIVFGGPLANFILAYVIYTNLLIFGEKVPEPKLGIIEEKSELYKIGFRSGDVVKTINGEEVRALDDLFWLSNDINKFIVSRNNSDVEINTKISQMEFVESISQLRPQIKSPLFVDFSGKNYFLLSVKNEFDPYMTLEQIVSLNLSEVYLIPLTEKPEDVLKLKYNLNSAQKISLNDRNIISILLEQKIYPLDVVIGNIIMDSPADKAKLKSGDIILSVDQTPVSSFDDLRSFIQNKKDEVTVSVLRDNIEQKINVKPQIKTVEDQKIYSIGIYSSAIFAHLKMVETKSKGVLDSMLLGFTRTFDGIEKTFDGFIKLFTAEVPLKSIGGPLAIGKVASDTFEVGLSMFFRLMALISINLGIINLFPIPVLDGGHIVFIGLELVNGGPLSRKKMQMAQQVGFSLLLLLIFVALFNDFSRFF